MPDSTGFAFTILDKTFILLRSVKTVSVVIFCTDDFGILVTILAESVLFAMNPEENDVVFITVPLDAHQLLLIL